MVFLLHKITLLEKFTSSLAIKFSLSLNLYEDMENT